MAASAIDKTELARLCREYGVVYAGLFGCQARGDASPESDVDVLVRFEDRQRLIDLPRIERKMGEAMGYSVDLVTESALSPYLRDQVMAELGVIVDDE